MKEQADKIIAEKLSSLESLPEDYHPNLDAKWSIVREGASKKPIVGWIKWIGIAASIVFLIGCFLTWNYLNKPEPQFVDQKNSPEKNHTPVQQTVSEKNEIASTSKTIPLPKQKSIVRNHETISVPEEITIPRENILPAPVVENEVTIAAVNEPVQAQKSKQRYVQVDFRDPVQTPVANNESPGSKVKVSISFRNESTTAANSENNSALRLKQNF